MTIPLSGPFSGSLSRRDCLKAAVFSSLLSVPGTGALAAAQTGPRRLLLIELNGGNDGLNTVVPYADPLYAKLRPRLAIPRDAVLQLDEHMGLHPELAALMPMFQQRELAVVQGLGYAQSNRSHFRSIEIWDTATDADVIGQDGWLSRIDPQQQFGRRFAADAVVIGRNPKPASGDDMQPVVMTDTRSFVSESRGVQALEASSENPALRRILAVQRDIESAGHALTAQRPQPAGEFPQGAFGRDAREAARLLIGDPATPVVKIALTGFDTHAGQLGRQQALLRQLGDTLAALKTAFTAAGIWSDVLVLTYSEFGRRVQENGSGGTDHGKAAPHFVLGGRVRGGLLGEAPALAKLDDGDVTPTLDYRCLYNAVLGRWWAAGEAQIEPARYRALDLLRA